MKVENVIDMGTIGIDVRITTGEQIVIADMIERLETQMDSNLVNKSFDRVRISVMDIRRVIFFLRQFKGDAKGLFEVNRGLFGVEGEDGKIISAEEAGFIDSRDSDRSSSNGNLDREPEIHEDIRHD